MVQRSRSASNSHRNLLNTTASELLKGFWNPNISYLFINLILKLYPKYKRPSWAKNFLGSQGHGFEGQDHSNTDGHRRLLQILLI